MLQSYLDRDMSLAVEKWMVSQPVAVGVNDTIKQAALKLNSLDWDCVPVVGELGNPVGILTSKILLKAMLNEAEEEPILHYMSKEDFYIIRLGDSILDLHKLPYTYFFVIDGKHKLVGVLTQLGILKGISQYLEDLNHSFHTAEIVETILDSAYEGVAVVDKNGIIVEFNKAYSRFTGVEKKDAIGRPVQEVIENTNLHQTVKTGLPERGEIQYIQGQPMVVHRIPLWRDGELVGAIGMLIFEGVTELYQIYDRFREKTQQISSGQKQTEGLPNKLPRTLSLEQIIGQSEEIMKLKRMTRKVAKTDATVMITGESGTGKEMFAKSIHDLSEYRDGPFISVNCGAIPEQLFESELFGYEEGAFTGTKKGGKPGKLELAEGGTLFLDEIGEMPLVMQTKLLRVLQEKEFERLGSIRKQPLKTRIVTATNRNLKEMVADGVFREDLYYRINVIELSIPPLRERKKDIPLLISHYLTSICTKYQIPKKEVTAAALEVLISYSWYGNIRELVNMIEKLVILTEGKTIDLHHLPNYMKKREFTNVLASPIHRVREEENAKEKEVIQMILEESGGNKSLAAKRLGIHRTTLYQKLKKYGL
ncbi:sigma 54-interacting transcriptional regulator [Sutcliffiella cohnii]|uniref:sigma 54-interacting transcriptional regulator n=1 Tax=Sutcliffiella cohnii TaxID=33932 RepID=UPI002E1D64AA|nr:sigma 54-interacting transcriptional regulator [Sutcliffiella cohnii]MED4015570.1 sigma 54-interacting transcriptional regulator [Sutcliffiella cohnii]